MNRQLSLSIARILLGLSALTGLAACTALKPGNVFPDGGAHFGPSSRCAHAEPPGPPARNAAEKPEHDYVFASRTYDVGDTKDAEGNARYAAFGYDLDHTCSGQGEGSSCKVRPWQTAAVLDGPEGRDNSANEVFFLATSTLGQMSTTDAGVPAQMTAREIDSNIDAQLGQTTVLLRIRGYNGEANDDQVRLETFAGTLWTDQVAGPKPLWDTHDKWHTTSPWLQDGMLSNDAPRFFDDHAYVRDDVLVAHIDSLFVGSAFIPAGTWRKVVITAHLSHPPGESGSALELHDFKFIGRWPINDLLNFLSRAQNRDTGALRCADSADKAVYDALKPIYCQKVDLSAERDDGSAPCDAISIVYDIDTVPAELAEPLAIDLPSWPDCPVDACDGKPLPPR
jgi:hypothetical protein